MSRRRYAPGERDLTPLERFIREEDSRRAMARIRRRAEALARLHSDRDATVQRLQPRLNPLWLLRRLAAWVRHTVVAPRTGSPPL
jgi:hypothetical protein